MDLALQFVFLTLSISMKWRQTAEQRWDQMIWKKQQQQNKGVFYYVEQIDGNTLTDITHTVIVHKYTVTVEQM